MRSFVAIAALLAVPSAFAFEPVTSDLNGGRVNWTDLRLEASARGVPGSGAIVNIETLEGDARTRLGPKMLELSKKVRIDAQKTAGDLLGAGDAVADRIDANLALWEVYEVRYYTSGGVEMDGALPLQAWLRPALVDMAKGKDRTSPPASDVTGLVIDARGLAVEPVLAPQLEDPSGAVFYSAAVMSPTAARVRTPVVYVHDPADPAAAARAGKNPVFVKAAGVNAATDLVLSADATKTVRDAAEQAPFLLNGQIVIVVGP